MADAEIERSDVIRVRLAWERPGRRLPLSGTLAAAAEVAVAVPVGAGRTLLAVADDRDGPPAVVSLWDPATAEQVGGPLTYPAEAVEAMIALPAPDGTALLAVAYQDVDGSLVQVWDPVAGERVGEPLPGPYDGSGLAAVPVPGGRHLLAVIDESNGALRLWDPVTGEPRLGPLGAGSVPKKLDAWAVTAMITPDGRSLLLTLHGDDKEAVVRSWDPVSGQELRPLLRTRHDEANPYRMAVLPLPDGRLVLALSRGHEDDGFVVRLWDTATGDMIGDPLRGDGLMPVPAADGTVPLLAVGDGLWDPGSGRRVGDAGTNGVPAPIAAVPSPDGPTLLAGPGPDGRLWLWDPAAVRPLPAGERVGPVALLTPVTLPGGRTLLATCGTSEFGGPVDEAVRFWDALTGEPVAPTLTGHARGVSAMASAPLPDGRVVVVTCDAAGTIRSWDPVTGQLLVATPTARANAIRSMTAIGLPDGRTLLATGNDMNVLRLRDPATGGSAGDMFTRLDRPRLRALAAVPMPDGRVLLAAGNATPARGGSWAPRLWDPATGLPVGEPFGADIRVWSLAATPAGHDRVLLAVATETGTVQVHDVIGREVLGELAGKHPCLLTGSDGRPVLAVGRRDEVQFWDPIGWRHLTSVRMATEVKALAAAGSRLAVGCAHGLAVLDLGEPY
ncbi:WD40 repeat domain-containing protein [Actinoplanes sp. L3-i22]|uniref:WD40 repeat domain-containing protein n=1 Tax=Actinoplanes sp. L3-i22 TaxID=2836373 RepID=UPI001C791444|nr:WD40 repeat domain-containing protein [Actinoplanes sp. L3-i22]BCY09091.1 hypothetical protein L3i22_041790 [Actinoplanes sp. L3-i22]